LSHGRHLIFSLITSHLISYSSKSVHIVRGLFLYPLFDRILFLKMLEFISVVLLHCVVHSFSLFNVMCCLMFFQTNIIVSQEIIQIQHAYHHLGKSAINIWIWVIWKNVWSSSDTLQAFKIMSLVHNLFTYD